MNPTERVDLSTTTHATDRGFLCSRNQQSDFFDFVTANIKRLGTERSANAVLTLSVTSPATDNTSGWPVSTYVIPEPGACRKPVVA